MGRPRSNKRNRVVDMARVILSEHHPMTLRQVFYQLVARQAIANIEARYKDLSDWLVTARQEDVIPWDWIEDRLRQPRTVSMWRDIADFAETAKRAYRRDVWTTQERLVEVWSEKDALAGIFEDVLESYGVTLNVGRGYDGWDSLYRAALRYHEWKGDVMVLYFGDFDPSGKDMSRSLSERLGFFGTCPQIKVCALLFEDIERYDLPPAPAKKTDSRSAAFIARYGDMAVELDALPIQVLRDRLRSAVESHMDLEALANVQVQEAEDRRKIKRLLGA